MQILSTKIVKHSKVLQKSYTLPDFVSETIIEIIQNISSRYRLEYRELLRRVLLQLPRFTEDELNDLNIVTIEIERIAQKLSDVYLRYNYLITSESFINSPVDLVFKEVPENLAKIIHEDFHYIGYYRRESKHLGLFEKQMDSERLVSMISLSTFDLNHIQPYLPNKLQPEEVLVVSRIFAFPGAPKNTISFMIGRMFRWLRNNKPNVKMLLTYLNPNAGFTGTSYKASNWVLYAKEINIKYAYLHGDYITLRALSEKFGTTNIDNLNEVLKGQIQLSIQQLEPLELYVYFLESKLKSNYPKLPPLEIKKATPIA